MKKICILLFTLMISLTGCSTSEVNNQLIEQVEEVKAISVNKESNVLKDRYLTPEGYTRIEAEEGSFGEFLRNSKLEPYGSKVKYYNGSTKDKSNVYDSVFDVEIGDRDLHQCADAVMLLRAEYLYANGRYDEINFHFVDGFEANYGKWMNGYRIKVGNPTSYYKKASYSNTYENFRSFMDMVFAYSSTLSLEKELKSTKVEDMKIGDVFIKGGSPGHCVIVVDMAENKETGQKIFMLAQSYMPAQQTQLLVNRNEPSLSPWYSLDFGDTLYTPEWTFDSEQLKSFE